MKAKTMNAVLKKENSDEIILENVPIPEIKPLHVLVKIHASVINPIDDYYIKGWIDLFKGQPPALGFEGCGVIEAVGTGAPQNMYPGLPVAFFIPLKKTHHTTGAWAEYSLVHYKSCIVLGKDSKFYEGDMNLMSGILFNQLTVMCFIQIIEEEKHKAVINTAAASGLGRTMLEVCQQKSIDIICVVRNQEEAQILQVLGAKYVLTLEDSQFEDALGLLAEELKATVAFDAIAGNFTGTLLKRMPKKGKIFVHGNLSGQRIGEVSPYNLMTNMKTIQGFDLFCLIESEEPKDQNIVKKSLDYIVEDIVKGGTIFHTKVRKTMKLSEYKTALEEYGVNASQGKTLFAPQD